MKKFTPVTLLLAVLILAAGCEKSFLDKESMSALSGETVIKTQKGMEMLLSGAYHNLQHTSYYGGLLYLYEAAKGPDFFVRNVGGGYSFYVENRYAESSNLNGNARSMWEKIYNTIRATSLLIDNIDEVAGDIEELRRIKGEAYALRGLCYFDLLRVYAYPPRYSCTWGSAYNADFKWGVPIIPDATVSFNILDHNIRRATADESWNYVVEQFEKAYKLLEGRMVDEGHVGPAAALGLLMRTFLYMEQNDRVVETGTEWLDKYESDYALLSYDQYTTQFYKPFNSESIWEVKFTEADNLGGNSINYWVRHPTYDLPDNDLDGQVSQNIGYAKLGLTFGDSNNGYETMRAYTNDVRRYLVCDLGIPGKNYRTIRRYIGSPYHFLHNITVIRLPEIYLGLSEAYFKLGKTTEASEYLTRITIARRKTNVTVTKVNEILDESRREYILEGHTYWDFFRNGRNITGRPIIESIGSTATISFGNASGLSYRVVYPIPLSEMNANPAIRDQQNKGYAPWKFGVEDDI